MSLLARLKTDLGAARKEGDAARVAVIRTLMAAIANAEAVELGPSHPREVQGWAEVPRRRLSAEDILRIVRREADELRAAAAEYEGAEPPRRRRACAGARTAPRGTWPGGSRSRQADGRGRRRRSGAVEALTGQRPRPGKKAAAAWRGVSGLQPAAAWRAERQAWRQPRRAPLLSRAPAYTRAARRTTP